MDESGELNSHPVVLSDGSATHMFENTGNAEGDPAELGRTRSYVGHLTPERYPRHRNITRRHKLAIFHYVTRSQKEYISRKSKLPSGIYTYTFVKDYKRNRSKDTMNDPLKAFADYENRFGFNEEHPVCSSAINAKYAERAWNSGVRSVGKSLHYVWSLSIMCSVFIMFI